MLPDILSFIDVETTGLSPLRDRVIEIGIIRVEKGTIVEKYESLINPECSIPPEITVLTGITGKELDSAPTFRAVRKKIKLLLDDAIFVAHNARFDYSFIKSEFGREEESFKAKTLCTARLSRALFPEARHHNLDSIIERFSIECKSRHRAYDDAFVLYEFLKIIDKTMDNNKLHSFFLTAMKRPTLPPTISEKNIETVPECPGVYIFYDQEGAPLYIGKSINLKERILSHFANATTVTKEAKIFRSIFSLETIPTDGELGALLLESELIKKNKPLLNRQLRTSEHFIGLKKTVTKEGYFSVEITDLSEVSVTELTDILAVFRTKGQLKTRLVDIANEYKLCPKLLGVEKSKSSCFHYQLGTCLGACIGKEQPIRYNLRFITAFGKTKIRQWPFPGAVVIPEGKKGHIVSHWCYLGTTDDPGSDNLLKSSLKGVFDYDAYKILSSYLLKPQHVKKIKILR